MNNICHAHVGVNTCVCIMDNYECNKMADLVAVSKPPFYTCHTELSHWYIHCILGERLIARGKRKHTHRPSTCCACAEG